MRRLPMPRAAIPCALAAAVLAGCAASASPGWDARFGDSTRILHAQQAIDPAAPTRNAQATPPTAGRTVRDAIYGHADTARNPPPSTVGVTTATER